MRRGHCRRLRGEAGKESRRGRAAFSRSVNKGTRRFIREKRTSQRCIKAEASGRRAEASGSDFCMCTSSRLSLMMLNCSGAALDLSREVDVPEPDSSGVEFSSLDGTPGYPNLCYSIEKQAHPHQPSLTRSWSTPCVVAEIVAAARRVEKSFVPLEAWRYPDSFAPKLRSYQEAAMLAPPQVRRFPEASADGAKNVRSLPSIGFPLRCRRNRARRDEVGHRGFDKIRTAFRSSHEVAVKTNLASAWGVSDKNVKLSPLPLAADVARRFVEKVREHDGVALRPTLHGTRIENIKSICQRGLLIPHSSSGVRSLHGLSHGCGIYSATLENARLACGFCSERKVLVCGVLDDAVEVQPYRCGNFEVHRESSTVRHVGDALVVFQPALIAPLFEASCYGVSTPNLSDSTRSASPVCQEKQENEFQLVTAQQETKSVPCAFLARRAARRRR